MLHLVKLNFRAQKFTPRCVLLLFFCFFDISALTVRERLCLSLPAPIASHTLSRPDMMKRTIILKMSAEATDSCCSCSDELSGKETAQLYPCNHKICLPCLCRDLAKKEHTRRMVCANCKCEITKHRVCLINGTTEKAVKHREPIVKDIYKDPSDAKDPYRYWCKKYPNEEERKGKGILYIAIEEDISIGKFFICDTIEISDALVIGSDRIRNTLVELARRFHSTLFPKPATRPNDSNLSLSLSISDLANEAIEYTHPTFLFLYSLATGDTLIKNLRDQIRNMKTGSVSEPKKDLLAIFSAFQLLQSLYANQNANNKQNTNSQLAIGSLLYDLQVEQKIIQTLSQFRIVPGITTLKIVPWILRTRILMIFHYQMQMIFLCSVQIIW
jgi:hypothetical protein